MPHFAFPWALLALPLLLALPRRGAWLWRVLALGLLILALAQPQLEAPSHDVVVLSDVSASVGKGAMQALGEFNFSKLHPPPRLYAFAADATPLKGPQEQVPSALNTDQTDIARALQVAAAAGGKRILLLSDGGQSSGDALQALPPGVPVDTFYVKPAPDVRLQRLLGPQQASPGETVGMTAVVDSDRAANIVLQPSVNDQALPPVQAHVQPGRTPLHFSFPAKGEGTLHVSATLQADFSQPTADDTASTNIVVSAKKPVLVLNDPAMNKLLTVQGFTVKEGAPADITAPLEYSAIILRDGAQAFTPGQLALLKSYVENGGGLMMTGGDSSFGLGAWYRTPVADVLPVNTDLRTQVKVPLVAMVIVLDRSQSMSGGTPSKISLAQQGALSVVDLAYKSDLLGLITFNDQSHWVFTLHHATSVAKRAMAHDILNIEPAGGTILKPAYQDAIQALSKTNASIKHIIVLTDGQLYDCSPFGGGSTNFDTMAAAAHHQGITTSTIAIGKNADFTRLKAIAQAGGGRYYAALDVSTLPRIFTDEALTATRSLLRDTPFSPTAESQPLMPKISGALPDINAYIATTLKKHGQVLIQGKDDEPILAVSRQGLGRSAALTTDLNQWAGPFGKWPQLPALLGTVTRWLQAKPDEYSATTTAQGDRLKVVVDAVKNGQYVNNQQLTARYQGISQTLEQTAPGRYEGLLNHAPAGGQLLVVDGGKVIARTQVNTLSGEFGTENGRALLEAISQRSGGTVIRAAGLYAPAMPQATEPIWPYFAIAGLLVFLLELVLRRYGGRERRRLGARD